MKYGGSLPTGDWGDVTALRDFTQALDEAGMDYVSLATHILGMPLGSMPDEPLHHYYGPFREPMVLFAFLSGQTKRIVFRPSVMILPLYSTTLLAKQAADISIMSGGRLELGVGISWNPREYQALAQDFHTRGRRLEEQITLLRRMWSEPYVSFEGQWHQLDNIGVSQLPPPIPILMGGGPDERILRRIARLGDGWIPLVDPIEPLKTLRQFVEEEGKNPSAFPVSGRLMAGQTEPREWVERVKRLHDVGIDDIEIFPGRGLQGPEAATRLLEVRKVLQGEFG
jgi:probable F420-dependent oxidoreductase